MNKELIIDIILCIVLAAVIIFEIMFGVNTLKAKWLTDTSKIIDGSKNYGSSIGLVETAFSWPDAPEPDVSGDVVAIDENRFKIHGTTSADTEIQANYVYYADLEDSSSKYVRYEEVLDTNKLDAFHNALVRYFSGDNGAFVDLLPVNTTDDSIIAYQQNFTDGAIPVMYDSMSENYFMFLDCGTSYYRLQCEDPFVVTDAKVTVHYASAADDPLLSHAWSTYEAGAIDNTRQSLMDGAGNKAYDSENKYTDANGNTYTGTSNIKPSSTTYLSEADDQARALLVSYGNKIFNEQGLSDDGSGAIDISSIEALKSQWLLTETQYSYTDNGITINGLSGSRSSTSFEISGNATNALSSSRPWVLCIKFMGDGGKLLGVKVIDNRSNPIPAKGVSYFTMSLTPEEGIQFADIVALQFAVH